MKRPEAIKRSIMCCYGDSTTKKCKECAYSRLQENPDCEEAMALDALGLIEQLQQNAQIFAEGKWVSVAEQLPAMGQIVLGYAPDAGMSFLVMDEKDNDVAYLRTFCTHWFPLPEPLGGWRFDQVDEECPSDE